MPAWWPFAMERAGDFSSIDPNIIWGAILFAASNQLKKLSTRVDTWICLMHLKPCLLSIYCTCNVV